MVWFVFPILSHWTSLTLVFITLFVILGLSQLISIKILKGQDIDLSFWQRKTYVSLYNFRTNTTLYGIGTKQILYQGSFIKIN